MHHSTQAQGCSCFEHAKELGWPTLASRRVASEAMAMSLNVSGCGPSYLADLFQPVANAHQHRTRSASSGGFHLPQVRTEIGKKYFVYKGTCRWNALPPSLGTGGATAICSHLLAYDLKKLFQSMSHLSLSMHIIISTYVGTCVDLKTHLQSHACLKWECFQ